MQLRRQAGPIQKFFEKYANLSKEFTDAYQWCQEELKYIKADWEHEVCGLLQESYPLYPQEPILLLIQSRLFVEAENKEKEVVLKKKKDERTKSNRDKRPKAN